MNKKMTAAIWLTILAVLIQACGPTATPTPVLGEPPIAPPDLYVSTTGDDSNDCLSESMACLTIQEAMRKASPASTIQIGPGTFYAPTVAFTPRFDLTFQGTGRDVTTLVSDRIGTIFNITGSTNIVIRDLTIGHGSLTYTITRGIEVRNAAAVVTLENCRVTDNTTGVDISDGATVVIRDCLIEGNQTGISNAGVLTLQDSVLSGNATGFGTAFSNRGYAEVLDTRIERNGVFDTTSGAGTAAVSNTGQLVMNAVQIVDNNVYAFILQNGTATLSNTVIADNGNAGIWHIQGELTGSGLLIQNNGSYGVNLGGRSEIPDPGTLRLSRSAIVGNFSAGVRLDGGEVHLQNVTISGNTATSSGGGGIWAYGGSLFLLDSTVAFNTGYGVLATGDGGTITARRSVVALNSSTECLIDPRYSTSWGLGGYACSETWTTATLGLGPLTADGGTLVHPLLPGSPLIDAGGPVSGCPTVDQRGVARPASATCDVGAYEYGATAMAVVAATPGTETSDIIPLDQDSQADPTGTVHQDGVCRLGPGLDYPILAYLSQGQAVHLTGRNQEQTWYQVSRPELVQAGGFCWISARLVTIEAANISLPHIQPPPPPYDPPTATPAPAPVTGCYVYNQQQLAVCTVPCPANAQPGGACQP
ncbi:MAG: right-handed parallel beta-helix repeat-containing protein [Anaerolineales bacterium]|nr:right-handed parallel beta-helix repeat-containing protein [Anaerolineales bacterium]